MNLYGAVAQLVERQVEALRVGGSTPPGPTLWKCPIIGYWPSLERSVVAKAAWRSESSHFREFGSVDLIGKAPGPNPVVRKFLM